MIRRDEWTELSRMAWPAMLSAVLFSLSDLADAALLGLVGVEDMAGAGLGATIIFAVLAFPAGMLTVLSPLTAHQSAALDPGGLRRIRRLALVAALQLGVLTFLLLLGVLVILPRCGLPPELLSTTRTYLLWRAPGLVPELLFLAGWSLLDGLGRTRATLLGGGAAATGGLLLNLLLIPGWFGLPGLGVRGAALSADLSTLLGLAVLLVLLRREGRGVVSRAGPQPAAGRTIRAPLGRFLREGGQMGATSLLGLADWLLLSALASRTGLYAAAGHDLTSKLIQLGMALAHGTGAAALVLVARAWGGRDRRSALRHLGRALSLQLGLGLVLGLAVALLGLHWLKLFTGVAGVLRAGSVLLPFAAAIIAAEGICIVLVHAAQAMGKSRSVLQATAGFDLLLGVPAVLLLGQLWGLQGLYLAWLVKVLLKLLYLLAVLLLRERRPLCPGLVALLRPRRPWSGKEVPGWPESGWVGAMAEGGGFTSRQVYAAAARGRTPGAGLLRRLLPPPDV